MEIAKQRILRLLRSQGEADLAELADRELPAVVDPEEHAATLAHLGIDPQDLIARLG